MPESSNSPGIKFDASLKTKIVKAFILVIVLAVVAFSSAIVLTERQTSRMNKLNLVDSPASETIETLNLGVEESLTHLRGYIIIKDSSFKSRRLQAWEEKVKPSIKKLEAYEWDDKNRQALRELKELLFNLEEEQWYVEDIAPTSGNHPARLVYTDEFSTIYTRLMDVVNVLVELETSKKVSNTELLLKLNVFEKLLSQISNNISKLVIEETQDIYSFSLGENQLKQLMSYFKNSSELSQWHEVLNEMSLLLDSFFISCKKVSNLQQESPDIVLARLSKYTIPQVKETRQRLAGLLSFLKNKKNKSLDEIQRNSSINKVLLIALLILLALSTLIISYRQAGQIVKPVQELNEAAVALATGSSSATVEVSSNDELGQLSHSFNSMKKQLTDRAHSLKLSEAKNKGIVDTAVDGIVTISSKGIVQLFNAAAEGLFGYSKEEVIGQNVKMLMPDPFHGEHDGYLKNYLNSGVAKIIGLGREVTGLRKDGSDFPAYLSVGKMNLDGEMYFTGIIRDISEEKKQLEKIEEINSKLRKKTAKDDYFVELSRILRESLSIKDFSNSVLNYIMDTFGACSGTLHSAEDSGLKLVESKAVSKEMLIETIEPGVGLAGKAAADLKIINISENDEGLSLFSGLAEIKLVELCILPLSYQGICNGIIQLGLSGKMSKDQLSLMKESLEMISITLHTIQLNDHQTTILAETQMMAEELQCQQEELKTSNDTLQSQQEELRVVNEELELNAKILKEREQEVKKRNDELEKKNSENKKMSLDLQEKARSLEQSNQYKSDFLASMSHELRTPLNCMLILSKILSENKKGNLSDKQVEYTTTIHQAGNALLSLINDVLNLAKIDAGKMDLSYSRINLSEFSNYIERHFSPLSKDKGLEFVVELDNNLPKIFISDLKALQQICRNLIFNAIKFTENGSVKIQISKNGKKLLIVVSDTGIGIQQDDQSRIFEAFQQLDKGNNRKYEGTGLGLSITKKLVNELKGEIKVESEEGKGSIFTLTLPLDTVETEFIEQGNTVSEPENSYDLLLVEDNQQLVKALVAVIEEKGLSIQSCGTCHEAMELVESKRFKAIILDLNLEENNSGLKFLKFLKNNKFVQPVIIYTGREIESDLHIELLKYTDSIVIKDEKLNQRLMEEVQYALSDDSGPEEELTDPRGESALTSKRVLVVDDDARNLFSLSNLLEEYEMDVDLARNGREAIEKIAQAKYDIILMDIMMPEMDGYEAIKVIRSEHSETLPILALTAKAMKGERERCIEIGASDYMSKPIDNDNLINQLKVWLS